MTKKIISIVSTVALLALAPVSFTSCSTTGGGIGGVISSAQAWLNDPNNQALIKTIEQTAGALLPLILAKHASGVNPEDAVVGKLAVKYPNVPAGALRQIVHNKATGNASP